MVAFDNFTVALLQPCFRNLKGLNLQVMKSVHCVNQLGVFLTKGLEYFNGGLGSGYESEHQIHNETSTRLQHVQYYVLTPIEE